VPSTVVSVNSARAPAIVVSVVLLVGLDAADEGEAGEVVAIHVAGEGGVIFLGEGVAGSDAGGAEREIEGVGRVMPNA